MPDVVHRIANAAAPSPDMMFFCPGCQTAHGVRVTGPSAWSWNGSTERPTFEPSVLVTWSDFTEEGLAMLKRGEKPAGGRYPSRDVRCHSFVRDGRIQFLADCTHGLAGQTVELQPF